MSTIYEEGWFAGKTVFNPEKIEPDENQLRGREVPSTSAKIFQDFFKFLIVHSSYI